MFEKYLNFVRGVSVNGYGKAGVSLTTAAFITFLILEIARLTGGLTNAYFGLIAYLLLPTLFVIGLILIPLGWHQLKKQTGKSTEELLSRRFEQKDISESPFGSKVFLTVIILTLVNVLFLAGASLQTLHFMEKPVFCGTACHSVMNPEWTTYQDSPHARVKCVECHVGEGVDALIDSKLNGAWQMISASFNLYERPIPTPVHQLRPARETCEKCHWPEKFYGSRLQTFVHYKMDSLSTPQYTTLNLKIDAGISQGIVGIHWHISGGDRVRYASVHDEREEMIWVEVKQSDGSSKRYQNTRISPGQPVPHENIRIMDCIDCHNRATHIYERPEVAVDTRIRKQLITRRLPFIKREALAAITHNYSSFGQAKEGISDHLYGFYRRDYPGFASQHSAAIDSAIKVLQNVWARNIHPEMDITWNSYPSQIGHFNGRGCFRCHNAYMKTAKGNTIPNDCTTCHSILAEKSPMPFEYLEPADKKSPDYEMHRYLQNEFLHYFVE